jgi:hypothetical protein
MTDDMATDEITYLRQRVAELESKNAENRAHLIGEDLLRTRIAELEKLLADPQKKIDQLTTMLRAKRCDKCNGPMTAAVVKG